MADYVEEMEEEIVNKCLMCSICLEDTSSLSQVVECQNCSTTVHRGCYGAQENLSDEESDDSEAELPWFCDPCRAGVVNPTCKLCPISGGAFKSTDEGRWVHSVCALAISDVMFEDPDALFNVSLAQLSPNRWSSKVCFYCEDNKLARTGVTVKCEKSTCHKYFHATCAQKEGLLDCSACPEEITATCVKHSYEDDRKEEKRNWNALQLRVNFMNAELENERDEQAPNWMQNQIVLMRYRERYARARNNEPQPPVPMEVEEEEEDIPPPLIADPPVWNVQKKNTDTDTPNDNLRTRILLMRAAPYRYHVPPEYTDEWVAYFKDRDNKKIPRLEREVELNRVKKPALLNKIIEYQPRQAQVKGRLTAVKELGTTLLNSLQLFGTSIGRFNPRLKIPSLDMGGVVQHPPASAPAPSSPRASNLGMVGVMSPHSPHASAFSPPLQMGPLSPAPELVFSPPELPSLDMVGIMPPPGPALDPYYSELPDLNMVGMMPPLPELSPLSFSSSEIPDVDMVGIMSPPPVPAPAPDHVEVQPQDDE